MIIRFYFPFIFLILHFGTSAQGRGTINSPRDLGFSTFSIKGSLDTVNFIVSDTSLKIKKPVFIFCQGSLPFALFFKEDSLHTYQQAIPFNYEKYLSDYNFVVISKPAIPIFTTTADQEYFYVDPISRKTPEKYFRYNYLDYYVTAANDVINYLLKQKWVDKSKIVIAGHSQGSKIVSKVGALNKNVTHVIYLSGNPLGRFDQGIRQQRREALQKKISPDVAQRNIDSSYVLMRKMYANRDDDTTKGFGDSYKSMASFSEPLLPYLLKINVPLFVAYGTDDITSDYCDLLPLDFTRNGKNNLTLVPYLDCDHSFNRIKYDEQGKEVSREELWDKVANDFFTWLSR
jgi:pimeloyl-ACP methyl ester carboxylesterase